jgi:uncharacterized protein YfaS (alpha-2-macroglobulin family)
MQRTLFPFAIGILAIVLFGAIGVCLSQSPVPANRQTMWKKVDDAIQKGLPKTAIDELKPIIESAISDKAYPEALKAIAKRMSLSAQIEGNRPDELIRQMKSEMATAPKEMVPTMHALLGYWYWSYFEQNRWQFANRTATSAPPGEDFQTWDLTRLFREIDQQYSSALENEDELKRIPIATFGALLEQGSLPDSYRPTLYDFLAFVAIEFYAAGEQAGVQSEDMFEIDASSAALGSVEEFLAWQPKTTDSDSVKLKALQLYQKLLSFHRDDSDRSAFLDADLGRLRFAYANAVGDEKSTRYKAALSRFASANASHELSATARHRWAEVLVSENEPAEARSIALQGKNAFPASVGGIQCANLIASIESKSVSVSTERTWAEPWPVLRVNYRNINKVYFRMLKSDWAGRFTADRWQPNQANQTDIDQWLRETPVLAWSADLPATNDFRENVHDVPAPTTLKPGYYTLISSARADFADDDNSIMAQEIWVTNLALVVRQHWGKPSLDGFVLDAKTGVPIANARVRTFARNNRSRAIEEGPEVKTNTDGLFSIQGANRNLFLLVSHNGHEVASSTEHSIYKQPVDRSAAKVQHVLFTDRAIYRPGQTIYFKGITLVADPLQNKYNVVANRNVVVQFLDINGKEIANRSLRTNDFGSFNDNFTAPRDRGTGLMTLRINQGTVASIPVRVEEYKRPKFQVTVDKPAQAAKLDERIIVRGKATAYTGAAILGAKVRYRVTREVRWPAWYMTCFFWRLPPNLGQAQEIAHGWATTAADGSFEVPFDAKPDRTISESDHPIFHYSVVADVTDSNGETRSGNTSIALGYVALQASLSVDDWLTTDKDSLVKVSTTTLDGEPLAVRGTLKVYRLKEPESVIRVDLLGQRPRPLPRVRGSVRMPVANPSGSEPVGDPADPRTWDLGDVVESKAFETNEKGIAEIAFKLGVGHFRIVAETQDRFGKPVTALHNAIVIDPSSEKLKLKVADVLVARKWTLEPGEKLQAIWGSGYDSARAYVEIEHQEKILKSFWTRPGTTQASIEQAIDESMRGGITIRTTLVRENRAYLNSRIVEVQWTNKELKLKWERFVSKLEPAQKEKFTLTITGPDATKAAAEMVATLYDASLDAFVKQEWLHRFQVFRREYSRFNSSFNNMAVYLNPFRGQWNVPFMSVEERYRSFPSDLRWMQGGMFFGRGRAMMRGAAPPGAEGGAPMDRFSVDAGVSMAKSAAPMAAAADAAAPSANLNALALAEGEQANAPTSNAPDLSTIATRTNLQETAFFLPQLVSDKEGAVKIEFTIPEALTKWRFLGFAHDRELRSGFLEDSLVTSKDLMVQPNPPRFLREGDLLEFSVKVSNQSNKPQSGKIALQLLDARTNSKVDLEFANVGSEKVFEVPANESKSYFWQLKVPDGAYPIIYKVVGATETLSDGEEGMLPVLSKRILVTESMPLPIRGQATREFEFKKLLASGSSPSLQHQSLSIQMTSQPAWYAVLALPYLMEFPHECSEQTFNRMYANLLAQHIAKSDPKIHRVFETWRNYQPGALTSPLSKNQDLKSVMIEETPWLRDAENETQSRHNVGLLFDDNRLSGEVSRAMSKLSEMQRDNGMWPWFPGGPDNEYLSLYIVTGFGRLKQLKVAVDTTPALKALDRLDAWMRENHERILRHSKDPESNHLNYSVALYMYGRSFFIAEKPIAQENQAAIEYWKRQAMKYWLQSGSRQTQAHIAIGLHRMGDRETPKGIVASLKERSVSNEEMGMFWRDTEQSWWWYHAPVESQAMMIEVLDEVANDARSVDDCKVWLLKQKQTQNWKTTKATADAVYALLRRGSNLLSSDALVQVKLAGNVVAPTNVEAGTGFYEQKFTRAEIKPEMGKISITKSDQGVSWGSIHWQYLEDISKVTPHDGTPLKLEKKLYKRTLTKSGPVLEAVDGPMTVGDEIVCRIVLRTDRDMEYVHLKDHRGSGTEPVNVLSSYKFQDGLFYYESTRDTASHFFIDYLRKGTYVFEYTIRIQHAGNYPSGMAHIECMYAPEFNSHSESIPMEVKQQ